MGNRSCCSCISSSGVSVGVLNKSTKTAMLLDTGGNIREIKLPAKSAELMIEEIGHVITPLDQLRIARPVSALRADEELVAGQVYLLLPVTRVHSKASEFEMAIAEKHSGQTKRASLGKVSPSLVTERRDGGNLDVTVFQACRHRPRNQVRWNPVLDPIFESSSSLKEFDQQFSSLRT